MKVKKVFVYAALPITVLTMIYVVYDMATLKNKIATTLLTESVTQTKKELDVFFQPVQNLLVSIKKQAESGLFSEFKNRELNLSFIPLISSHKQISSIGYATKNGYEMNVIPDSTENVWLNREVYVDKWGFNEKWRRLHLEDTLRFTEYWEQRLLEDPRNRPWFKGAISSQNLGVHWTTPYKYTTGPDIGITASVLIEQTKARQKPTGILAFDVTLTDLDKFINNLNLTGNHHLYLFDKEKKLVIASYSPDKKEGQKFFIPDTLVHISDIESPQLKAILDKPGKITPFQFKAERSTWWGMTSDYKISPERTIKIVSALPEKDFSIAIYKTQFVLFISFLIIFSLTFMIVNDHVKIGKLNKKLSQTNMQISDQKKFLFSEVHHRVKNNLAIISAFNDLDIMESCSDTDQQLFKKSQLRIKVMAISQEVAYQSNDLGLIPVLHYIEKIAGINLNDSETDVSCISNTSDIKINVNQGHAYGLLMNEILQHFSNYEHNTPLSITITISKKESLFNTSISIETNSSEPGINYQKLIDDQIIQALRAQLNAELQTSGMNPMVLSLVFELKDKKGIHSNWH